MNQIIQNPGLQHIIENVFLNLDFNDLLSCQLINQSCNELLKNPMFWLKKWRLRGLSKKNEADWAKAIQMTRNTNFEKNIFLYFKKIVKFGHFVDIPCYIDNNVLERSKEFTIAEAFEQRDTGIIQLLVPSTTENWMEELLKNPMFWLKIWRLRGLSKKNEAEWAKVIRTTRNTNSEKNILLYMKWKINKNGHSVDVPCYIDKNDLQRFGTEFDEALEQRDMGILQLLAPLTENWMEDFIACARDKLISD